MCNLEGHDERMVAMETSLRVMQGSNIFSDLLRWLLTLQNHRKE